MQHFASDESDPAAAPPRKSIAELLPRFVERHLSSASPFPCGFCTSGTGQNRWCGTLYCSNECRMRGEDAIHSKVPSKPAYGATGLAHPYLPPPKLFFCRNRFTKDTPQNKELLGLIKEATVSLSAIEKRFRGICGYDDASTESGMQTVGAEECALLLTTITLCVCPEVMSGAIEQSSKGNRALQNADADEEMVEEMWAMARSHRSLIEQLQKHNGPAPFPSCQTFMERYLDIKRCCLLRVDAQTHPLVCYASNSIISKDALTEEERDLALKLLECSWLSPKPSVLALGDDSSGSGNVNGFSIAQDIRSTIVRWRYAAHFVHWASNPATMSDPDSERIRSRLRTSFFVYSPTIFRPMSHSCAPTLMLTVPDPPTEVDGELQSPLDCLVWLALHDIPKGEATISKLDSLEDGVAARSARLARLVGTGFDCGCIRCQYEVPTTSPSDVVCWKEGANGGRSINDALSFTRYQLKCLADQAMQQGRFGDATSLYNTILHAYPHDGDVLHARAASYLGRASSLSFADVGHCKGHFVEALHLWAKAGLVKECADHPEIAVQVAKQLVYKTTQQLGSLVRTEDDYEENSDIAFTSHLGGKCFVTRDPIISREECQQAIDAAEEFAVKESGGERGNENGGWTTSRHYAVPTTDIPLHELTALHSWFYSLWKGTIRPVLQRQFGLNKPPRRDIFLHDAFLVRYDSQRQRYLPPHVDESTHSFIIALNDDFKGGGTYIHSLGRTLAPPAGGMMSFCGGEVLHSGDPVVDGVRYIIAAFCYVDLVETAKPSNGKQTKLKGMFAGNTTKGEKGSAFSFGFNAE